MARIKVKQLFVFLCADLKKLITFDVSPVDKGFSNIDFSANKKSELNQYFIKYTTDAGNYELKDVIELMEYVLIFCHELAHCLNNHSVYRPEENTEYSAMEAHADFLAGRMATALYTYGYNLQRIIGTVYKYDRKDQRTKSVYYKLMSKAISKLYFDFYKGNENPRYPHPTERLGLNIAGISSFFFRSPQFQTEQGDYIMSNWILSTNLDSEIQTDIKEASVLGEANSEFLKHVLDVHLKIQGDSPQINDIQSPQMHHIFGTQYINNEQVRRLNKERMKNEILNFAKQKGLTHLINEETFEQFELRKNND